MYADILREESEKLREKSEKRTVIKVLRMKREFIYLCRKYTQIYVGGREIIVQLLYIHIHIYIYIYIYEENVSMYW